MTWHAARLVEGRVAAIAANPWIKAFVRVQVVVRPVPRPPSTVDAIPGGRWASHVSRARVRPMVSDVVAAPVRVAGAGLACTALSYG